MFEISVQSRSNVVDIFGVLTADPESPALRARPVTFEVGKRTTDPDMAMLTLTKKRARELGQKLLRVTASEDV